MVKANVSENELTPEVTSVCVCVCVCVNLLTEADNMHTHTHTYTHTLHKGFPGGASDKEHAC